MDGTIVQQRDKYTFMFVDSLTKKTYKIKLLNTIIEKLESNHKYKANIYVLNKDNKEQLLNFKEIEFKD